MHNFVIFMPKNRSKFIRPWLICGPTGKCSEPLLPPQWKIPGYATDHIKHIETNCQCIVFSCGSSIDRDRWIGLQFTDPNCGKTCRDMWMWIDGHDVSYHQWHSGHPKLGALCSVLSGDGLWYSRDCSLEPLKFICKRGMHKLGPATRQWYLPCVVGSLL